MFVSFFATCLYLCVVFVSFFLSNTIVSKIAKIGSCDFHRFLTDFGRHFGHPGARLGHRVAPRGTKGTTFSGYFAVCF